ncbi:hypothetical protein [Virgibacillus ndiopensis]|uniref:hypothetical protein n=1 Tax=Virgibacillus ndiopensis TaxID=2004408 RepID=UPI000C06DD15|nr:hypothetical protein [Virgibacillus ndiopensis]
MDKYVGHKQYNKNRNNNYGYQEPIGGKTGNFIQLIGNMASAFGDSLQALGQGISMIEDQQQQHNKKSNNNKFNNKFSNYKNR